MKIDLPVVVPTSTDVKPCNGKADLFESTFVFDHQLARIMCRGDGKDTPACPFLQWCHKEREAFQATEYRAGLHGTWHGDLFIKGRVSPKGKERPGRPRKEAVA